MRASVIEADALDALIVELDRRGYRVLAPVLERGALTIAPVSGAADLPRGLRDEQAPGHYRLVQGGASDYFGYTLAAAGWKQLFLPSRARLWAGRSEAGGVRFEADLSEPPRSALIGVRACDLAAIAVQDRVFLDGPVQDANYRRRRAECFVVGVNCATPADTCFCGSMGCGPKASAGYDLALTELTAPDHRFLVECATSEGESVLAVLPSRPCRPEDSRAAESAWRAAQAGLTRTMPAGIRDELKQSYASPRWEEIAERCLACGNCTLVCPTCFCTAVEDTTDLAGGFARSRRWDSCFTAEHSYIHGGSVHASTASRYRQWMTHKLSTWWDQFGTSGCTGCGRCIAWCPAAIDITAEAHALSQEASSEAIE